MSSTLAKIILLVLSSVLKQFFLQKAIIMKIYPEYDSGVVCAENGEKWLVGLFGA